MTVPGAYLNIQPTHPCREYKRRHERVTSTLLRPEPRSSRLNPITIRKPLQDPRITRPNNSTQRQTNPNALLHRGHRNGRCPTQVGVLQVVQQPEIDEARADVANAVNADAGGLEGGGVGGLGGFRISSAGWWWWCCESEGLGARERVEEVVDATAEAEDAEDAREDGQGWSEGGEG